MHQGNVWPLLGRDAFGLAREWGHRGEWALRTRATTGLRFADTAQPELASDVDDAHPLYGRCAVRASGRAGRAGPGGRVFEGRREVGPLDPGLDDRVRSVAAADVELDHSA